VLRPAWDTGSAMLDAARQWTELAQLEQQVDNRAGFDPPSDGVLPPETLQRFFAVQQQIDARLGTRLEVLDAKYRTIQAELKASAQEPTLQHVLGAYGDMFGLIKDLKRAQIDALNAQRLSLAEYRWARNQAYRLPRWSPTISG
jgi:hypothetical protein